MIGIGLRATARRYNAILRGLGGKAPFTARLHMHAAWRLPAWCASPFAIGTLLPRASRLRRVPVPGLQAAVTFLLGQHHEGITSPCCRQVGASLRRPQRSERYIASFSESSDCAKSHTGGFWGAVGPLPQPTATFAAPPVAPPAAAAAPAAASQAHSQHQQAQQPRPNESPEGWTRVGKGGKPDRFTMKNFGRNPPKSGKRKQEHRKPAPKGGGPPPPSPKVVDKNRLSALAIGRLPFWQQREHRTRTAALSLPHLAACQIAAAVCACFRV